MDDSQGGSWTWTPKFADWVESLESIKKWDRERYPDDVSDAEVWLRVHTSDERE